MGRGQDAGSTWTGKVLLVERRTLAGEQAGAVTHAVLPLCLWLIFFPDSLI